MGYGGKVYDLETRKAQAEKYVDFYEAAYNTAQTEEDKWYYKKMHEEAVRMSNLSWGWITASGLFAGGTEVLTEYFLGYGRLVRSTARFNATRFPHIGAHAMNLIAHTGINIASNVSLCIASLYLYLLYGNFHIFLNSFPPLPPLWSYVSPLLF